MAAADVAHVVDFADIDAVADVGRLEHVEGIMTFASDRAVPIVAAAAKRLGLPSIGVETAHRFTNKIAMRRRLAELGVPQPQFAAVRSIADARAALDVVGLPAVLKPADAAGQRGLFLLHSFDDLAAHLHAALAASSEREAIVESYHEGVEVNTLVVAAEDEVRIVTASDRLRPAGVGFGVAIAHLYPSTFFGDLLAEIERVAITAVHALELERGIAYPQLLVTDSEVLVVEAAARIPGGQMVDVARLGTGVDLLEIAALLALGERIASALSEPRFQQPLAVRFLTAQPGPLPTGRVRSVGTLDRVLAFPGVVQAEVYLEVGDTIRPVQIDGDRRGYVIALADTNLEALERAEAAATLVDVEVE